MGNMIADARARRTQKIAELKALNYVFSVDIDMDNLSYGEAEDLMALEIGQETYADDHDVKRIG